MLSKTDTYDIELKCVIDKKIELVFFVLALVKFITGFLRYVCIKESVSKPQQ